MSLPRAARQPGRRGGITAAAPELGAPPMPVAELPGVSMWYDERGQGDPCVLLHPGGAGIDSRALGATLDGLARVFRAYTPEQRAHRPAPDADGPLSYDLMAGATIAFIERVIGQ